MANLIIQENGVARTRPAVMGEEITIKTPCSCDDVTGVQINGVSFPFYCATGKSSENTAGLFAANSLIRVMIDTDNVRAYILNADTNAYLEGKLAEKYSPQNKPTASDVGAVPFVAYGNVTNLDDLTEPGMYSCDTASGTATNIPMISYAFALLVEKHNGWGSQPIQTFTDYGTKRTFKRARLYDGASFVWNEWVELITSAGGTINGNLSLTNGDNHLTLVADHSQAYLLNGDTSWDNYVQIVMSRINPDYLQFNYKASGQNPISRLIYHTGNITASTTAPTSALPEGAYHDVYK